MALLFILLISFVAISQCESQTLRDTKTFQAFMKKFNKSYGSPIEQERRFRIVQTNLREAEKFNKASKFAQFGMSKFLDLTREEFESQWLMPKVNAQGLAQSCLVNGVDSPRYSAEEVKAVPSSWDWRTKGVVTGVKNQEACGSCWTFSTTGNIEGLWALKGNKLTSFSEQEIVDCSHACCNIPGAGSVCNQGCNGGFQWNAMFDIMSWGGLMTEAAYPYVGYPPYIYQNGPISIALNAQLLMSYYSGIIDPFFPNFWCNPDSLDHALLIVGWGTGENWIGETIDYWITGENWIGETIDYYWIVKNSWGTDWGEQGYFRIARNINLCGIANSVVSAIM